MKISIYGLLLLFALSVKVSAQPAAGLAQALRYIKAGNTLREANQFTQAAKYLNQGLAGAKNAKDAYWMAAAYENLGWLYRDMNDATQATFYLNKAFDLYKGKYSVSALALQKFVGGLKKQEEIYGGIDIGARGVKVSVIALQYASNGRPNFRIIKAESINTGAAEGTPAAFAATAKAVRSYLDTLLNRRSIVRNRVFVVGSSGLKTVLENASKLPDLNKALKSELSSVWPNDIPFIDAATEAELTVRGTIAQNEWLTTATLDIGSGNTKGGYFTADNQFEYVDFPGTSAMTRKIQDSGKPVAQSAQQVYTDEMQSVVGRELGRKPEFENRRKIYVFGGIVYALITYLHPQETNKTVVQFSYKDALKFQDLAIRNYEALTNPDMSGIDSDDVFKKAQADVKTVREKIFKRDEIIAGATLLRGILEECRRNNPETKEFHFHRNGQIGWISGFIMKMIETEYQQQKEQ
ncbi:tetratricopeptide repeat protein [Spirosoma sordidisoli]|uniref:Tetratricopeptide repeat protein n=1 Tax=Spirosoma sordidisoli TaxID=2502893 RepID=A0A4Q2UPY4_9BACT|nr:tetratricopeptide repeat protein [Spirosoma sordidisoli]RYC69851.1 tetratricopeptide repeat protein [Spirosoma sordidisoli]